MFPKILLKPKPNRQNLGKLWEKSIKVKTGLVSGQLYKDNNMVSEEILLILMQKLDVKLKKLQNKNENN